MAKCSNDEADIEREKAYRSGAEAQSAAAMRLRHRFAGYLREPER